MSHNPHVKASLVIRSDIAVAGWVFMAVWSFGVAMMTWGYFAWGGFGQFDPMVEAGIVMLFWVFTLGGAAEMLSKPRTRLTIDRAGAVLVRVWPARRREDRIPRSALAGVEIATERDEDGHTYRLDLTLASGEEVVIRRSRLREEIEDLHREIRARA